MKKIIFVYSHRLWISEITSYTEFKIYVSSSFDSCFWKNCENEIPSWVMGSYGCCYQTWIRSSTRELVCQLWETHFNSEDWFSIFLISIVFRFRLGITPHKQIRKRALQKLMFRWKYLWYSPIVRTFQCRQYWCTTCLISSFVNSYEIHFIKNEHFKLLERENILFYWYIQLFLTFYVEDDYMGFSISINFFLSISIGIDKFFVVKWNLWLRFATLCICSFGFRLLSWKKIGIRIYVPENIRIWIVQIPIF